jgi:hypothetical protein
MLSLRIRRLPEDVYVLAAGSPLRRELAEQAVAELRRKLELAAADRRGQARRRSTSPSARRDRRWCRAPRFSPAPRAQVHESGSRLSAHPAKGFG